MDLERCCIGPTQWDQATVAFQSDTLSDPVLLWDQFADAYVGAYDRGVGRALNER